MEATISNNISIIWISITIIIIISSSSIISSIIISSSSNTEGMLW